MSTRGKKYCYCELKAGYLYLSTMTYVFFTSLHGEVSPSRNCGNVTRPFLIYVIIIIMMILTIGMIWLLQQRNHHSFVNNSILQMFFLNFLPNLPNSFKAKVYKRKVLNSVQSNYYYYFFLSFFFTGRDLISFAIFSCGGFSPSKGMHNFFVNLFTVTD